MTLILKNSDYACPAELLDTNGFGEVCVPLTPILVYGYFPFDTVWDIVGDYPAGTFIGTDGYFQGTPTEEFNGIVTIVATTCFGKAYGYINLSIVDNGGCDCTFFASIEFSGDDTFDVTGQFAIGHNLSVTQASWTCGFFSGGFHTGSSQIKVYANGSLLYDSGCVSGAISTSVAIPAGTTSLRLVHVHDCLSQCESGGVGDQTAYFECT